MSQTALTVFSIRDANAAEIAAVHAFSHEHAYELAEIAGISVSSIEASGESRAKTPCVLPSRLYVITVHADPNPPAPQSFIATRPADPAFRAAVRIVPVGRDTYYVLSCRCSEEGARALLADVREAHPHATGAILSPTLHDDPERVLPLSLGGIHARYVEFL